MLTAVIFKASSREQVYWRAAKIPSTNKDQIWIKAIEMAAVSTIPTPTIPILIAEEGKRRATIKNTKLGKHANGIR